MTDLEAFYAPQATHNPLRFVLPVARGLCVGPPDRKFLFGGVGLATSVSAMEQATDRPLVWATAQYLSYAEPDAMVDVDVRVPVRGNNITQARVVGHVGEREIFTVNGALGDRTDEHAEQFAEMPDGPRPEDCDPRIHEFARPDDLHSRFEVRPVVREKGFDEGHSRMWIRPVGADPITSSLLAVVADYVPSAIRVALDRPSGANSLDNTIRVQRVRPTEWLLCDTQITGIARGFVHGRMYIFADDGELLATASQSGILRVHG
jgi:acyl-CoA thioesterase